MDYQPYHPPITLRRIFDRDHSPNPSDSTVTARRIFDFDTEHLASQAISHSTDHDKTPTTACQTEIAQEKPYLVPPPRGQLSKPNHGGYTLHDALGWDGHKYKEVQVGKSISSYRPINTIDCYTERTARRM